MAGTDYVIAPQIPRGLAPAIEGLAREILRQRPRDIYTFAAHHFEELIKLRDKEQHSIGIVSKILNRKSFHTIEHDCILDWTGPDNSDLDRVKYHKDNPCAYKCGNLIEEAIVVKEKPMTSTIAKKAMLPKKKKRETSNQSGWSINRTVKVFKQYEHENDIVKDGKFLNTQINEKSIKQIIRDYSEQRSPQLAKKIVRDELPRSSSTGNVFMDNIKRRIGENRNRFNILSVDKYTTTTTTKTRNEKEECDGRYGNANSLKRQKSADQIERICTYFGGRSENGHVVGRTRTRTTRTTTRRRRRSRSLVNKEDWNESLNVEERTGRQYATEDDGTSGNWKDQQETVVGDRQKEKTKLEEKFPDTEETTEKLNLRLEKMNEEESKDNEMGEMCRRELEFDLSANNIFDDSTMNITTDWIDRTISVVLPSVVARQSSEKCTRINVYESNERNSSGNFTLPPISSDALKLIKKENNCLTLPSLSNDADIRCNERPTCCYDRDGLNLNLNLNLNLSLNRKEQSEKEFKVRRNFESMNSDYDSKSIQKEWKDEQLKRSNVNEFTLCFGKHPWHEYEEYEIVFSDNTIEPDIDKMKLVEKLEIMQQQHSNLQKPDNEEVFNDSLNVTPDSIDLSQRLDSSEYPGNENENENENEKEEKEEEEEEEEEEQDRYGSNELKKKLIEIETVERSIENTLATSRSNQQCENKVIFVTDRRGQVYVEDESMKKNSVECQSPRTEGNKDNDDSIKIDGMKDEVAFEKCSFDNSKIFIDNDIINIDRVNVQGTSKESLKVNDPSYYILTEGSPCKIPETVTTVIIPDKILQTDNDVLKFDFEDTTNDTPCLDKQSTSPWNLETREGAKKEEYRDGTNLFGEYIRPKILDCSTNIDAHFLREMKNTADRISAYQDLGNIKEEEENEWEKFSNDVVRYNIDLTSSRRASVKESMEDNNSIESEAILTNLNDQEQDNVTNIRSEKYVENKEEDTNNDFAKHTIQDEETSNDRLCNFSLSFEETGPRIPELNLDSLRDVTMLSSIERNDSKNFENQSEKENGNITCCESENISLSSVDDSTSGKEPMIDQIWSLENEFLRKEHFVEHKDQTTEIRSEIGKCSKSKFLDDESIDALVPDKDEENYRQMEKEIARELIDNFIQDASMLPENIEARNVIFLETNNSLVSTLKYQTNNINRTDDRVVNFHSNVQELAHETATEEYSRRERIYNNSQAYDRKGEEGKENKREAEEREAREKEKGKRKGRDEEEKEEEQTKEEEEEEEEEEEVAFLENRRKKDAESTSLRNTGEFHDSLSLPFIEISKNVFITNINALKVLCQTTNRFLTLQPNLIGNRKYTSVPSVNFFDIKSSETIVPCAIDVLEKFRLLDSKSNLIELTLNISPSISRIEHVFDETRTTIRTVVPFAETTFNSGINDPLEPLALDNTPKPVIIEEISNVDEEKEQANTVAL